MSEAGPHRSRARTSGGVAIEKPGLDRRHRDAGPCRLGRRARLSVVPSGSDELTRGATPLSSSSMACHREGPAYLARDEQPVVTIEQRRADDVAAIGAEAHQKSRLARVQIRSMTTSRATRRARPRAGRRPWPCEGLRPARRWRRGSPCGRVARDSRPRRGTASRTWEWRRRCVLRPGVSVRSSARDATSASRRTSRRNRPCGKNTMASRYLTLGLVALTHGRRQPASRGGRLDFVQRSGHQCRRARADPRQYIYKSW